MSQVLSSAGRQRISYQKIPEAPAERNDLFRPWKQRLRTAPVMSPAMPQDTPTVFVVDDDFSVRESLKLLISFAGWTPETFASAEEFLARPRVPTPSCLVSEVSLPDLNGLELQERVAAHEVEMPVIFITGHGD